MVLTPVLSGCISEGDTREEAISNIRKAIDLYLEPVPEDDGAHFAEGAEFEITVRRRS
uniref:HicB_like antitoxin of toxin-antitoxin system n=1 Tax=Candidatus Kentrum sp. TC TaxID=2126339 RepID=A0A451A7A5_9GAMM|nr:MAG: HicB_like antitoxin of toxin-antitoxin system [Candidatus Kentron sp. TC]